MDLSVEGGRGLAFADSQPVAGTIWAQALLDLRLVLVVLLRLSSVERDGGWAHESGGGVVASRGVVGVGRPGLACLVGLLLVQGEGASALGAGALLEPQPLAHDRAVNGVPLGLALDDGGAVRLGPRDGARLPAGEAAGADAQL